jgi:hypothetical protein
LFVGGVVAVDFLSMILAADFNFTASFVVIIGQLSRVGIINVCAEAVDILADCVCIGFADADFE